MCNPLKAANLTNWLFTPQMTFSINRNICHYLKSYKAGQNMANKAISQQWLNTENVRDNSIFLTQIETHIKWPQPSFTATVCNVWRVIRAHDTGSTVTVTWLLSSTLQGRALIMNNWALKIFTKSRFTKLILPIQNCPSCAIIDK